jgi:hypothetical protein
MQENVHKVHSSGYHDDFQLNNKENTSEETHGISPKVRINSVFS